MVWNNNKRQKIPPQNWKKSPPFSFALVIKRYFFVRVPTLKHTLIILVVITCRAAFHVTWARLESKSQPLCEIHLILVLKHSYFQMIQSTCLTGSWGQENPIFQSKRQQELLDYSTELLTGHIGQVTGRCRTSTKIVPTWKYFNSFLIRAESERIVLCSHPKHATIFFQGRRGPAFICHGYRMTCH